MPHTLAFVDSIVASPSLRLNLSDGVTWTTLDNGTEFPTPQLRRSEAANAMTDGSFIASASYENRVLRLRLNLTTSSEDASATALQNLYRELDRPFNFLKFQAAGASNPVYFSTFRSDASAVVEGRPNGEQREVSVMLLAKPFALGPEITLSPVSVTNNPASTWYFDVTGVKGDLETPLIMTMEYGDVSGKGPAAVAVRRRGTPSSAPAPIQCESMTMGTNTSVSANDAVMSGAGSNYATCTFGTATLQERLTSAVHPSSASVDARGQYRVFLRVRRSSATGTIAVQLKQTSGTSTATNRKVTLPATTDRRWIDLGIVQVPFGYDPQYHLSGVEFPARGTVFSILAERTVAGSNLDFDVIVFMPADDRLAIPSFPSSSGATSMVFDGTLDGAFPIGASGEVYARELLGRDGAFPLVSPGQTNRVFFLLNGNGEATTVSDDITSVVDITPSYYPRYLYVRPAST